MKLKRYLWSLAARRAARSYGFLDPIMVLARMRRFSEPSEAMEPLELLRAGVAMHARGLINTKTIQNNLDWIWPHWVQKQFNPRDPSFLPRAYSISHINLTQRNWTAVSQPDYPLYPIVDPRGLLTPLHDGWSIDAWLITEGGPCILPSKAPEASQHLYFSPEYAVETVIRVDQALLLTRTFAERRDGPPCATLRASARTSRSPAWIALAIRPFNPEGIQFIDSIATIEDGAGLLVNGETKIHFSEPASRIQFSCYKEGDVFSRLFEEEHRHRVDCPVGMATAAALFPLVPEQDQSVEVRIDLDRDIKDLGWKPRRAKAASWAEAVAPTAKLNIADSQHTFLYQAAKRALISFTAGDPYPGPYSYRRFWFRDAAMLLNGLLAVGLNERAREALDNFPSRQKHNGYYESQEGEWDANGEALWICHRVWATNRQPLPEALLKSLGKGMHWIGRKRLAKSTDHPAAGLMPAGFSAEHLGPNDYYYWDNFWCLAGLRSVIELFQTADLPELAAEAQREFDDYHKSIFDNLHNIPPRRSLGGFPAAPGRRMDSGAVGSICVDYPLQLVPPDDPAVMRTVDYLIENCFHDGGFFQDMIHSGVNIYLTLHIAQVLMRAGDPRWMDMIRTCAGLASPTGQWPEAIHPQLKTGCMGDGQHGWAAAEWVLFIRNAFVREEETDTLVVAAGLMPEWLKGEHKASFGPTLTAFGPVTVAAQKLASGELTLEVEGQWHQKPARIEVAPPGYKRHTLTEITDARMSTILPATPASPTK